MHRFYKLSILQLIIILSINIACCIPAEAQYENKIKLVSIMGEEEYNRLMQLSLEEFDQSPSGFKPYSNVYEVVTLLIPEYIRVNETKPKEARNLRWHLGQIHALNNSYKKAIQQMKQAYIVGSKTRACYVDGTIAFL